MSVEKKEKKGERRARGENQEEMNDLHPHLFSLSQKRYIPFLRSRKKEIDYK